MQRGVLPSWKLNGTEDGEGPELFLMFTSALAKILSSPLMPSPANINHLFLPSVISNQPDSITYIFGH